MSASSMRLRSAVSFLAPFLGVVVVFLVFSILTPEFLSLYNLKTILTQTVIVALGAIGMTYVIVAGGIDLSVGSVIALSSVLTAIVLRDGGSVIVAVGAGVAAGALVGLVNGLLTTRLSIVPFIVTLGTMSVARGVSKWFADEQKVDANARGLETVMSKSPDPAWLLVGPGVWLTTGLALAMGFVLLRTTFGTYTKAIGSNEATARLCGVPVERVTVAVYVIAGVFAGLAGVMQFSRLTVGDPTAALGLELNVIAAVVIGGGSLSGGRGGIGGSMIGALLMAMLANGCNLAGLPNYVQEILVGAIIVAAVAADRLRSRSG
ncbi:MAG: ABC transporter permease [Myxococcota bacterium]